MIKAESSGTERSGESDTHLRYLIMQVGLVVLFVTCAAISWAVSA